MAGLIDPLIPVRDLLGTKLDPADLGDKVNVDGSAEQEAPVPSTAPDLQELADAITTRLDELAADVTSGFRDFEKFQSVRRQFTLILLASVLGAITSLLVTAAIVRLAPEMITSVDMGHDTRAHSSGHPGSDPAAADTAAEGLDTPEERREAHIGDVVEIDGRSI